MKLTVCSLLIGLIGFALPAWADQHKGDADVNVAPRARGHANVSAPARVTASPRVKSFQSTRASSNVAGARFHAQTNVTPRVKTTSGVNRSLSRTSQTFPQRNVTTHRNVATQPNVTAARQFQGRSNVTTTNRNVVTNRNFVNNRNVVNNRGVTVNRNFVTNRNVAVTNHWNGSRFNGQAYAAFRNYNRQWHNRDWWRHRFNHIVFVNGGWFYWNTGYWYPAWGYDPYASYAYDGPIYGYASMSPDREIVNVQSQLQRDGYYAGPIDGQLGPMTRQAIAAFQADQGLAVTSAIDEPTLDALGLA